MQMIPQEDTPDYSLSTSWNIHRHLHMASLAEEVRALGIHSIEASYNCTAAHHAELEALVQTGSIRVSSLHNFSPMAPGRGANGDAYLLSSTDEDERVQAVRYSRVTLETAARLGVRTVVFHLGHVDEPDPTWDLRIRVMRRQLNVDEVAQEARFLSQWRQPLGEANLHAVIRSLEDLSPMATRARVTIGLENRMGYGEIPAPWELRTIFDKLDGAPIGYWHDMGHAEFLERLGLVNHADLLAEFGPRLVGTHLHDTMGLQDHLAPGTGTTSFDMLRPHLTSETVRVIELGSSVSIEDAQSGIAYLRGLAL